MPTATLHSGLSSSKTITEPTTKVPIQTHQATNSALPTLMSIRILDCPGDDERFLRRDGPVGEVLESWALTSAGQLLRE